MRVPLAFEILVDIRLPKVFSKALTVFSYALTKAIFKVLIKVISKALTKLFGLFIGGHMGPSAFSLFVEIWGLEPFLEPF